MDMCFIMPKISFLTLASVLIFFVYWFGSCEVMQLTYYTLRLLCCQAVLTTLIMETYKKNWFKYLVGFIACLLIRLIPFRPPNIEPILATQMPFSKAYGKIAGFLFAFLSMVFYDIITSKVGMWTFITASTYGFLGLWASLYFKNKNNSSWNYAKFAVMGTLVFDIITGLSVGPLLFHQPFMEALAGQIPFTALHLAGNVGFAVIFSPLIYRFVIENKKFETHSLMMIFNPKRV